MTFTDVRNAVVKGLGVHIGCAVIPSEQIADKPKPPYCYYSVLSPRASSHSFGLNEVMETPEGAAVRRSEPVSATMSFTFCGENRETEDGYIFGDDEALALAEKGFGFFLLDGHCLMTSAGDVVVRNIGTVASRSGFVVEDTVRRYGFDVRLAYVRTDVKPTDTIPSVNPSGKLHKLEGGNAAWQKT